MAMTRNAHASKPVVLALITLVLLLFVVAGAFALRGVGMSGVPTEPSRFEVQVKNQRDSGSTVELMDFPGGTTVSHSEGRSLAPGLLRLEPGASVTIEGKTEDFYSGLWLRFAASGTYTPGQVVSSVDQPTGMIEIKSDSWFVALTDDEQGRFRVRVENVSGGTGMGR